MRGIHALPTRKRHVIYLVVLVTFVITLSQIAKYDLRAHKWTYSYLMDLPDKHRTVKKQDECVLHVWQPGLKYALVDVKEPYLKSYRNGNVIDTRENYRILHYNEATNMLASVDNGIIKDTCAYQNCYFTNNRSEYQSSSALIFSLSHGKTPIEARAPIKVPGQVWIFFEFEPPVINSNFFYRHKSWRNVMNWSLTNRLDSDIVLPYGTMISRSPSEIPTKDYNTLYKQKTKFAFWIVSNCKAMVFSGRNEFVQELQKHVPVDIYGACGTKVTDAQVVELFKQYKYYLSLENSLCKWYVTEKFFRRYMEDIVLITRGGADYDKLFPSGSFIDSANFRNTASLAQYLIKVNASEKMYTDILRTKDKYDVKPTLNWQCQLCAKLNNQNHHRRLYESIVSFWHVDMCWKPTDVITVNFSTYGALILFVFVLILSLICISKYLRNERLFSAVHRIINARALMGKLRNRTK